MYTVEELFVPESHDNWANWLRLYREDPLPYTHNVLVGAARLTPLGFAVFSAAGMLPSDWLGNHSLGQAYSLPSATVAALLGATPCTE